MKNDSDYSDDDMLWLQFGPVWRTTTRNRGIAKKDSKVAEQVPGAGGQLPAPDGLEGPPARYKENVIGANPPDPAYSIYGKNDTPFQIARKLVERGDVFGSAKKLGWFDESAGFGWLLRTRR